MQSSKTSKQSRKKASDTPAATAATAPVKEAKSKGRPGRTSSSKNAVEPVPAAAKSHRKTAGKVSSGMQPESTLTAVPAKAMGAASGSAVAVATDPLGPPAVPATVSHEEVAKLAYSYWVERNGEHGYAEHDWQRALNELNSTP